MLLILFDIFILLPALTLVSPDMVASIPGCSLAFDFDSIKPFNRTAVMFFNSINTNTDTELTPDELDQYFKSFDSNDDGIVEEEEFVAFVDANYPEFKCYGAEMFENFFDFNKDKILDETDFKLIVNMADADMDTIITEDEFVKTFSQVIDYFDIRLDLDLLLTSTKKPTSDLETSFCDDMFDKMKPYDKTALQFFYGIDTDNDTVISSSEIDVYFKSFDSNTDGVVEKEEFVAFVDANYPEFKCYGAEMFENFDFNKDKVLDETDFQPIINMADADMDTIITEDEFVKIFSSLMDYFGSIIDLDSLLPQTN